MGLSRRPTPRSLFLEVGRVAARWGLGRLPGSRRLYYTAFKVLHSGVRVIDVEGGRMVVDFESDPVLKKTFTAYVGTRHWDPMTTRVFKHVVKKGDAVLDLGANLGYYTLLAANLVGPDGRVVAIEPEPRNYRYLTENVRLNEYAQVETHQIAVSDVSGSTTLYLDDKDSGGHSLRAPTEQAVGAASVSIQCVALDEFLTAGTRVDVVKMDVEGYEPRVLLGMRRLLAENDHMVLFVEFFPRLIREAGSSPEDFIRELIGKHGFGLVALDDNWRAPRSLSIESVEQLMAFVGTGIVNLVASKRVDVLSFASHAGS